MSMLLASENVKVFPFGSSRDTDKFARVLNEQNIVKILTNILDKDSFLVSRELNIESNGSKKLTKLEFVLKGYYFNITIDLAEYTPENISGIYAYIKINDTIENNVHLEGDFEVEGSVRFTGLLIDTANANDGGGIYGDDESSYKKYPCLQLLEVDDEKQFQLCKDSMIKFDSESYIPPEIDYTKITFEDVKLDKADFTDANLSNANFTGADLSKANFNGVVLSKDNLTNTDMSAADFSKVKLTDSNMPYDIEKDIELICCGDASTLID